MNGNEIIVTSFNMGLVLIAFFVLGIIILYLSIRNRAREKENLYLMKTISRGIDEYKRLKDQLALMVEYVQECEERGKTPSLSLQITKLLKTLK